MIESSFREDDISWRSKAACKGIRTDNFYPTPKDKEGIEMAKAVCEKYPVTHPCMIFTITRKEPGIWGGTTERERKKLMKQYASKG